MRNDHSNKKVLKIILFVQKIGHLLKQNSQNYFQQSMTKYFNLLKSKNQVFWFISNPKKLARRSITTTKEEAQFPPPNAGDQNGLQIV